MTSNDPPRVALITGAARRIGAAICTALHQSGWNVLIHCHMSRTAATELADEFNHRRNNSAQVLVADLNSLAEIRSLAENAIKRWGRLDALINNASSFFPTPIPDATDAQWNDLLNSNLKAPFFLSQQLYEELRRQHGCIINISDIFAVRPMPKHAIYSIAKAGNAMLTQSLALEMAPDVRVNGVAPGAILWPKNTAGEEMQDPTKLDLVPMAKLGGTQAITDTVLFLINRASYITGQIIAVDGGRSLRQ